MPRDPDLPPLFSRTEALAAGMTRHQVANRVRRHTWIALRRTIYCRTTLYDGLPPRDQHLLAVMATMRTRSDNEVVSHLSAACVLGLPLPFDEPGPVVTLTCRDVERSTRYYPALLVEVATIADRERMLRDVSVAGHRATIAMTTPSRTVADNLRHLPTPDGVAVGDAALRRGLTTYEAVRAVLARQADWPYAERGRSAVELLDPRRETWLESHSFVRLHRLGLPMPEPQVTVLNEMGEPVARVDGWLDDCAIALEADGREKYFLNDDERADLPTDVNSAAEELRRRMMRKVEEEKRRESAVRHLGAGLERWSTHEVLRQTPKVLARIDRARALGDRSRFRGRTAYLPSPWWLQPPARRAG